MIWPKPRPSCSSARLSSHPSRMTESARRQWRRNSRNCGITLPEGHGYSVNAMCRNTVTATRSTLKFIYEAQPSLHGSKSPLVIDRQKSLAALGNHDTPAMFVVIDHSQRCARPAASMIDQFLENEPAQINAGNALLGHLTVPPLQGNLTPARGQRARPSCLRAGKLTMRVTTPGS